MNTTFKEITRLQLDNQNLECYIAQLANSDSSTVQKNLENFLSHLIKVHDKYSDIPFGNASGKTFREANHHGFLTGALSNYKYRYNGKIYPEQFSGSGYADLVVLFRGPDRITNAVRIVIELKASGETPTAGLVQTDKYTAGPTRVLTTSDQVFCVGLNFDFKPKEDDLKYILNVIDNWELIEGIEVLKEKVIKWKSIGNYRYILETFNKCQGNNKEELKNKIKTYMYSKFRYKTVPLERPAKPLMERILTYIYSWNKSEITKDQLEKQVKNAFSHEYNGFPAVKESKKTHYFNRYILGQSILVNKIDNDNVKKYLFSYEKSPLKDEKVRGVKPLPSPITLAKNPVTTLFFIRGNDPHDKTAYVFHIKEFDEKKFIEDTEIQIPNESRTVKDVVEIYLNLKSFQTSQEGASFDGLFSIGKVNKYKLSQNQGKTFKGTHIEIPSSEKLKESFNKAIDSQSKIKLPSSQISSDISSGDYGNLFDEIAKIMYPIKDSINNEAQLQGFLNGLFSSYSDLRLQESFGSSNQNQRTVIIPEFQTGGGPRVDMLIQAIGPLDQGTKEYVPVLLEFKVDSVSLSKRQKKNLGSNDKQNPEEKELITKGNNKVEELTTVQRNKYAQGAAIKAITDGDKVAVMGVLFNTNAKGAGTLIFTSKSFTTAVVVHSSITESRMAELEYILREIKGEGEGKRKDLTFFELATKETRYDYRLQAQDIPDIARIEYGFITSIDSGLFKVVRSIKQLTKQKELKKLKGKIQQDKKQPLTLIINLNNEHWVTLVVSHKDGKYQGYYADSLGKEIPKNCEGALKNNSIIVEDLTCQTDKLPVQQTDGYNCGLWALENARDINDSLRSTNTISEIKERLMKKRDENYFKEKRISLLKKLNEDPGRLNNLRNFNYKEYYNGGGSNVNLISCLGGSIRTRNTDPNSCLISCDEDVKKFNAETEDPRNYDKINIDSEEFFKNSSSVEDENRQPQLMQLVDEVTHSISTLNLSNESAEARLDHLKEQMSAMHNSKIDSTSFPTVAPTDITPLNLIHNSNNFSEAI